MTQHRRPAQPGPWADPTESEKTAARRSAGGAATREAAKKRKLYLVENPIDWDERIARLYEIFEELKQDKP
jgi:hypothetical protein